jgi:hypothetical protein
VASPATEPSPPVADSRLAIARQTFGPQKSRRKEAYTPARIEASPVEKINLTGCFSAGLTENKGSQRMGLI